MNDTFDLKDGWLCVRSENEFINEPMKSVSWYPICRMTKIDAEELIGQPAQYLGGGLYVGRYKGIGFDSRFLLTEGGNTKPIAFQTMPIPQPAVRKGVRIRYHNSTWQKYLKSSGWVTV